MKDKSGSLPILALLCCLYPFGIVHAQMSFDDPPKVIKSSAKDKDKQKKIESLKEFAHGILAQREDRLLEALQHFEKAAKLDPNAVEVHRKLVELYGALKRTDDAADACKRLLKIDPKDASIWFQYSRQLRLKGETDEALVALDNAAKHVDQQADLDLAQQIYFDLGTLYSDSKKRDPAAKAFEKCADIILDALPELKLSNIHQREIKSKLVGLYERIAKLNLEMNRIDEAVQAYQSAKKHDLYGGQRWDLNLAKIRLAQNKNLEALQLIDSYLKLQPQSTEAYEFKISLLMKLGRSNEVLPWLKNATDKDRFNDGLQLLLAQEYGKQNRWSDAESIYNELLKKNPKADIYTKLFDSYKSSGPTGIFKTLNLINKKIEESEGDNLVVSAHAKAQVRAILVALRKDAPLAKKLFDVAMPLAKTNDLEHRTVEVFAVLAEETMQVNQAEAFYRKALARVTPSNETVIFTGLLRMLWKKKNYEEVVAICRRGLKQTQATNHLIFHSQLSSALARLGKMKSALEEAKQAINIAPETNRLGMQLLYVRLLMHDEQYKEAVSECKKLLAEYKMPGDILRIRSTLSHIYSTMENFSDAEKELELVLKVDPNNAGALNDLGYLWADYSKNLAKAEEMIRKAIELDREDRQTITNPEIDPEKDNAAYIDSLGWVLFRRGKLQEALKELQRATKLPDGDDPVIWSHLGDVQYKMNDTPSAVRSWEKAVELYETNHLRPMNQRYKDLKTKLKMFKTVPVGN